MFCAVAPCAPRPGGYCRWLPALPCCVSARLASRRSLLSSPELCLSGA